MQKRFSVLTVVFLSLLMSLWSSDISANDAPVTIIESVNVVDMRTGEVRPNMSVVANGRWYSREVIQQRLADIAAAYN